MSRGAFYYVPHPYPQKTRSRNDGHGIPVCAGTGSNGTHGNENPRGIGLRVGTKNSIVK